MSNKPVALIVDDEPDIRELLEITLRRMDIGSQVAANLAEARSQLARRRFDLCLTDMRLPDGDGLDLVSHIQQSHATLPVAVITAHGSMEAAIEALKRGAFDFITKPVDLNVLRGLVSTALKVSQQYPEPTRELIGESQAMRDTRTTIAKLARSQAPVYISGESGTGKELVARMIHEQGPRAGQDFVPVNCGAIPQDLIESELFGHKKGSFTGAAADKPGLFQTAHGGTLFLDEVAELPLHLQVKLLRAIQEKAIRPVGSQKEVPVDVRILSATHKDLGALVAAGQFRQDLFYRINVIELHVPALRERPEDIAPLVEHILGRLADTTEIRNPVLDEAARGALERYGFPGNVRELENILERALTLCEGSVIREADLRLPRPADAGDEKARILAALERTRWNRTAAARMLGMSLRALRYRLDKLGIR
jgi:two-component system response regulator PilR (NtrC family)